MKRRYFSLIEMLVVIAIIAILISILMPVVSSARNNAKKAQAKAQMNAISTAIKTYESIYGVLPIPAWYEVDSVENGINKFDALNDSQYLELMDILTNVDHSTGAEYEAGNSRNIRFLDVPDGYVKKSYVDPWGNYFKVYMDVAYTGTMGLKAPISETLYGTVFIYSTANLKDEVANKNKFVYSWK